MRAKLFIFILALSIRLGLLSFSWDSLPKWEPDENGYQLLSIGLLKHQSFRRPFAAPNQPEHLVMPGYPLLLATVYRAGVIPHRIFLLQSLLDALTTVLIMGIIERLQGSSRSAVIGGTLYAIWPSAPYFCMRLYVEPLLTFLVASVFFILTGQARQKTLWLSLLCTAGIYVKPNFLLIAGIIGFVLFIHRSALIRRQLCSWPLALALYTGTKQLLLFAGILLLCIIPWIVRNKIVTGKAMLSTVFSVNFITISAPYTLAELDGHHDIRPWSSRHCEYWELFVAEVKRNYPNWSAPLTIDGSNDFERLSPEAQHAWKTQGFHTDIPVFAYMNPTQLEAPVKTAWRIIQEHPFAFLMSHLRSVLRRWLQPRPPWFVSFALKKYQTQGQQHGNALLLFFLRTLHFFWLALYYMILVTAIGGLWRLAQYSLLMTCTIGATIIFITFLPGQLLNQRFMLPAVPLLLVLSSLSMRHVVKSHNMNHGNLQTEG